ncbi:hypothetical protein DCOP10_114114 [Armatimonadetes bacterium DC]|nr:hypothetical protein DCOP10_114114 [Armatimonadetes bacterium DC]
MRYFLGMLGLCWGFSLAYSDGYLWLSAASTSQTPQVYRFNLRTAQIDRTVSPAQVNGVPPSPDYTPFAYDGSALYLGAYDQGLFARLHGYTGSFLSVGAYDWCSCFFGHHGLRDGAAAEGVLWRAAPPHNPAYSYSYLVATDPNGELVEMLTTFAQNFALTGLESVNGTLYGTGSGRFVRIRRDEQNDWLFHVVDYALSGVPASHQLGGLAYDPLSQTLYMATASESEAALWSVQIDDAQQIATASLVALLHEKGYPLGSVPTALTWVPAIPGDANGDGCTDDADLLNVLFNFGGEHLESDLNRDGVVDDADLLEVLFQFGQGCGN